MSCHCIFLHRRTDAGVQRHIHSCFLTLLHSDVVSQLNAQIALVLIDEVHLLNESRGAALEAGCVSRIRMVSQLPEMKQVLLALDIASGHPSAS